MEYASEIISGLIGAILGASVSVLITVKIYIPRILERANIVDQSGAAATGDIVGRDKTQR